MSMTPEQYEAQVQWIGEHAQQVADRLELAFKEAGHIVSIMPQGVADFVVYKGDVKVETVTARDLISTGLGVLVARMSAGWSNENLPFAEGPEDEAYPSDFE